MKKQKVLLIVGPTAIGKTSLSLRIAKQFNGEIISGDSMQVYKGLDIGTSKILPDEMQGIPHHLIDCCSIEEKFSVAKFVNLTSQLIREINDRHCLPIIVGGTGFYIQALLDGLSLGTKEDIKFRKHLSALVEVHGSNWLWNKLSKIDLNAAKKIDKNNTRRIIRAIEVFKHSGKSINEQINKGQSYDAFLIGLNTRRNVLYDRINRRVDLMIEQGLVNEAKWLYLNNGKELQCGKGIGYKELFKYFDNEISLDDAIELIKKNSRHYAKRQLTWFNNKMNITHWYDLVNDSDKEHLSVLLEDVNQWVNKT